METKIKYNSFAFVLVFFLYSLTTLPGNYINQGALTIGLSSLLLLPWVLYNVIKPIYREIYVAIAFELILFIILLIEILIYPRYEKGIFDAILYLLSIGTIGLIIGCFKIDVDTVYKYGSFLAYICAVTSCLFLLTTGEDLMDVSMRFGYALLPSVLWFLMMFFKKKSLIQLLLFFCFLLPLLIWGSRGAILVVLIFLFLTVIKGKKIFLLVIPFFLVFYSNILDLLSNAMMSLFELTGAEKIMGMISIMTGEGEKAIGGRDNLYMHCINLIKENPMGNGVSFWMYDPEMEGSFPHNVFLHIGCEFGIIGIIFIITIFILALIKTLRSNSDDFLINNYLFSIAIGRLLVSSMYWARPEFWLFISYFLFKSHKKYKSRIIN